jgi:malto-oligosyltrehalose trehalohydrolase
MPFGAQCANAVTAFRLWAPAARAVDLVLDVAAGTREVALSRGRDEGWFEACVDVGAGARYAYRIDGDLLVPDPASRANPDGVHGRSVVVDPGAYAWRDDAWPGRPWREAVVYELHTGAFTPAGTFAAAIAQLDYLAELGVTAVELMPVAAFPGRRNWGYDGVLPFAPAAAYGTPDDLRRLVDAAHARGLMMLLDVVYNHFGPEGNYLRAYAPQFFNPKHRTPWGDAINFDGDASATVREFFIHNALYWLEEFRFDGLRLDAVHAIADDSRPDFVSELAARVRAAFPARHVHLVLENDRNESRYLRRDQSGRPVLATAQWNDDLHHALHVIATGEDDGYYADYAQAPLQSFGKALAEGFVFQGQPSAFRKGAPRGEPSAALPPPAFVSFAQNHDQVGNRAFGERLSTLADPRLLRALTACVLLSPQVPLSFMGEEFAASTPFLFFCDFEGELAQAVTNGRREEFGRVERFRDSSAREAIPDPNAESTFAASKLDWRDASTARGSEARAFYRECLALRRRFVVPLLSQLRHGGTYVVDDAALLHVQWRADSGRCLQLFANLSPVPREAVALPAGEVIFATPGIPAPGTTAALPAYAVAFIVEH